MGTIDETTHSLRCPDCGVQEAVTIYQKGSAYGASWQTGKPMVKFDVTWGDGDALNGPRITSATCIQCGAKPDVKIS